MTKEEILETLAQAAPFEFSYDREASRYDTEEDEKMICYILGGAMKSGIKQEYDFMVDGKPIDLKIGNSINMSCMLHPDVDVLLISKDGTKANYIEKSEIDIRDFRPSKYSTDRVSYKFDKNGPKCWPILETGDGLVEIKTEEEFEELAIDMDFDGLVLTEKPRMFNGRPIFYSNDFYSVTLEDLEDYR